MLFPERFNFNNNLFDDDWFGFPFYGYADKAENRAETEGGKVWKAGSETAVWPERGKGKEER